MAVVDGFRLAAIDILLYTSAYVGASADHAGKQAEQTKTNWQRKSRDRHSFTVIALVSDQMSNIPRHTLISFPDLWWESQVSSQPTHSTSLRKALRGKSG